VFVRSPLLCKSPLGICKKCYGRSLENGGEIEMGRAVGVIAAQSIGEPGTQMTMQTFHKGGVQRTDITQGLPRIEELFEARRPKAVADIASIDGKVSVQKAEDESATITIVGTKDVKRKYIISDAKKVAIEDGQKVKAGQLMYIDFEENEKQAPFDGEVSMDGGILVVTGKIKAEETVSVLPKIGILVEDGQEVEAGDQLIEGSVDPKKLAEVAGLEKAQRYIINNVQKVFNEQGVAIGDVHVEIIIRQMARLARVLNSGDTDYLIGSYVNRYVADTKNELLSEEGKNKSLIVPLLLGIKASSLHTESFLSSMSFQEQVRVLTHSAILGKQDYLRGMKENVIIGRRIPSGDEAEVEDMSELPEIKI
jgi:DNA-directed RNA polymerase subunit beta'